jgi:hypothetical protein
VLAPCTYTDTALTCGTTAADQESVHSPVPHRRPEPSRPSLPRSGPCTDIHTDTRADTPDPARVFPEVFPGRSSHERLRLAFALASAIGR